MENLTIIKFNAIPPGKVFATGVLDNSPEGIFMTNDGGKLRWVAKKGYGYDWAVYCHWDFHSEEYVENHGDKVCSSSNILKCVPCDKEVLELYRY